MIRVLVVSVISSDKQYILLLYSKEDFFLEKMRTSRRSKDTAKLVTALSSTLASASTSTSISTSTLNSILTSSRASVRKVSPWKNKKEYQGEDEDQSSFLQGIAPDIEDVVPGIGLRKRKRGADAPLSTTASTATATSTTARSSRISRLKALPKLEDAEQKPAKERRKPAHKVVNETGEVEIHPPSNWENVYDAISEMRKRVLAPVDTMGCETLAEAEVDPKVSLLRDCVFHLLSTRTLLLLLLPTPFLSSTLASTAIAIASRQANQSNPTQPRPNATKLSRL